MTKKFYVTTAIAYPNSVPHLGHALEIIQADVIARFNRLLGSSVFFQTGTDEHGVKNWQTAQKEGVDVKEFLNSNAKIFKDLYKELNISYDNFIRTTDKSVHFPGAQKLWEALSKSGDIYSQKYKGMYCSGCEAFKTEKELEDGICPNHPTKKIESVEEENYFFRLSKYKDQVIDILKKDEYKVVPEGRKNEVLSFLEDAKDISFSRSRSALPWGIPVPGDDTHVMYVWCDALSNYISGIGYGTDSNKFESTWPCDVHVVGKDILRFHAAFWPAMLLSAGLALPKELFVHGFILTKGQKMSKSTGNIIEPFSQIKTYGVDQFRYYMLGAMPLDSDGEYTEDLVVERINSEFVANVSNFCYRVLSFTNKNFDSSIKEMVENPIITELTKKVDEIKAAIVAYDFKRAVDEIMAYSALGNKFFQESEPWKVQKDDPDKARKIIGLSVNIVRDLCILLKPITPTFAENLEKQLNLKNLKWSDIGKPLTNHTIGKAEILMHKIKIEEKSIKFPLNLKVAQIMEVKDHPDADKLLVMKINLGSETRQLVAGIKEHYSTVELEGKKIIVVTNLKPAVLRGVKSEGMLLAADDKESVGLLTVSKSNPGDSIYIEGIENNTEQIKYDDFSKVNLISKDNKALFNEKPLQTKKEDVFVEKVKDNASIK